MISIIVPTLNEERRIGRTLECLLSLRGNKEIIVADGGSDDRTVEYACASGVTVMLCERGRGSQMHAAALASRGEELWFLHADTVPEGNALEHIRQALRDPAVVGGNFSLVFEGDGFAARQMTWIYPRLRLLGLCFGDAGLFVRRSAYEAIGGFQPFPLFEDLDLMGRLRRCGRFVHLNARVYTSCRRFTGRKYAGAWAGWIVLQVLFWMGVSPFRLARWYHNKR
jgi:rSAM/selenodomain-associated transferase 2